MCSGVHCDSRDVSWPGLALRCLFKGPGNPEAQRLLLRAQGCCARAARWDTSRPGLTWRRFMDNKNAELDRLNGVYMKLLAGANVEFVEGRGRVVDAHTVEVDGRRFTVRAPVQAPWRPGHPVLRCALSVLGMKHRALPPSSLQGRA